MHFDGHGVFDANGNYHDRAKQTLPPRFAGLKQDTAEGTGKNTGYLLFEDEHGKEALIAADRLGELLHQQQISLVVLSACQSAQVAGEEPFGSVAARLTQTGIPAILAMPYSVLITTTRMLFAEFYKQLAAGKRVGESLDNARRKLLSNPTRGDRQRGLERVELNLEDWFVPTLYQSGKDNPLLQKQSALLPDTSAKADATRTTPLSALSPSNLPSLPEVGFFGRTRELWEIERAFVKTTRRLTIYGFGGQGKTALAQEAGRWLLRTGMFDRVCFVDYAQFQGVDAVSLAVATLATVLERNIIDADAARVALAGTPTLLVLDNLESLAPEPLRELLDAGKVWSAAGRSRLLLTSRTPDFNHPDYGTEGTRLHIALPLRGLGTASYPDDALAYLQALMALMALPPEPLLAPPQRDGLIELCKLVEFHPLSLALLARQLKTRRVAEVGKTLERLLAAGGDILLASLRLSLERLDEEARGWLPRLGVFQGGAFEANLLAITELDESIWQGLRQQLEATGLIQVEWLAGVGVPYIKFHPTLAPALWSELSEDTQQKLLSSHRQHYYALANYLYKEDIQNPHFARSIFRRELSNLMFAVRGSIDDQAEWASDFVDSVNRFLDYFGLKRERAILSQQAESLNLTVGSNQWYMTHINKAEQLFNEGYIEAAVNKLEQILTELFAQPSYHRCVTLGRLGRCLSAQKQLVTAEQCYRDALAEAEKLEVSIDLKRQQGILHGDLADALTGMGDYVQAKAAYETGLMIAVEQVDSRQIGVIKGQLGTHSLLRGDLVEADRYYKEALTISHDLCDPASESVIWHQLGMVKEKAQQLLSAEQAYRRAAEIEELLDNLPKASLSWNQLAIVNENLGNLLEAEAWYRKALALRKVEENLIGASTILNNLADLLSKQPNRLSEARELAEKALEIRKTIDPSAAQIWKTYVILARISDLQQENDTAQIYRRQAQQSKFIFAGTRYELQLFLPLIAGVVATTIEREFRQQLDLVLEELERGHFRDLVAAIRQILAGERDEDRLCGTLDLDDSMVVMAILRGIDDPATVEGLRVE